MSCLCGLCILKNSETQPKPIAFVQVVGAAELGGPAMKTDYTAVSYNGVLAEAGLAVNPASPSETAAIEISEIAALPDMKKSAACVGENKIDAQQQMHKGEVHSEQAPSTDSATQPICADKVCWTTALVALSRILHDATTPFLYPFGHAASAARKIGSGSLLGG